MSPELQQAVQPFTGMNTNMMGNFAQGGSQLAQEQKRQQSLEGVFNQAVRDGDNALGALGVLKNLTDSFLPNPELAFQCGTAMAASFNMMARLYEAINFPIQALRSNQLASLFASFDYQMKGEEYIDKSPWPIVWKDTVE